MLSLMNRQLPAMLTLLTIGLLGTPAAQALATFSEIQPNQSKTAGLQFQVTRTIDKNPKQYRFTVAITQDSGRLEDDFSTSLSIYHTTKQSASLKGIRNIPCRRHDQRITCNFTVPTKAVQNPELVFSFSPDGNSRRLDRFPSGLDNFFFRLKSVVST